MRTAQTSHVEFAPSPSPSPLSPSSLSAQPTTGLLQPTTGLLLSRSLPAANAPQRLALSIRITCPAFQLFRAWKDLAGGQAAHTELKRAAAAGFAASAVIKAPCLGNVGSALLVDQIPGLFLAWQSLPHATLLQRGEVWFHQTSTDQASEVCVMLSWETTETSTGNTHVIVKNARAQISQDLERFKLLMEH